MAQPIHFDDLPYEVRCQQDERRTQPRLRCKGVAEIIVLAVDKRMVGTLLDLSVNGCCIETSVPLPPIESPAVEVVLSVDCFTLRLAGVVRNVRQERRAGIEFIDVTKRKGEQIEELVKELLAREYNCQSLTAQPAEGAA